MLSIAELYQLFLLYPHIQTDSRKLQPNAFFVCLKGDRFNGNDFAHQALEGDAAVVVMDEDRGLTDSRIVLVHNCLETLQNLARHHRSQLGIPIVGLTGSNGKTTSKELFRAVLEQKFRVAATQGNLNNHIGVPLTLLGINQDHEIGIVEMGANAQREIAFLSEIAQPDIGYITNFGKAHLEGFGGVEGVIQGKSELYVYLRSHGKTALINSSDQLQMEKSAGIERLLFGPGEKEPHQFDFEDHPSGLRLRWGSEWISTQLTGAYNFSNVAAAFRLGLHFGLSSSQIRLALEQYVPTNQRSELRQTDRNRLIVDCYNANPSSMKVAIENLQGQPKPHCVILGDMFEMGTYEAAEHQAIVDQLDITSVDQVILIGPAFGRTQCPQRFRRFPTTQDAQCALENDLLKGFTVLLKGSRGMALEALIPYL
ncbi:UDP-N-acetylmuramoyl-tripeptide--D-alanyl-D-alanine ligase [bacterium]|nr:UDP-N-acetylmuramoyl-tripeptide--D-alanyl-D-alanine ligase [bacterium]